MTVEEDMHAMTDRIVNEALEVLRAEAEQRETADRLLRTCDDSVDAAEMARQRLREMDQSPEMPGPMYDAQTRLVALCDDAVEAARWTRVRLQWMRER